VKKTVKKAKGTGHKTPVPSIQVDEAWALSVFDSFQELVCLCREGKIEHINAAGITMLGCKKSAEILGKEFADFAHKDYQDVTEYLLDLVGGREPVPIKLLSKKGQKIDVEILVLPSGRDPELVILQARDITDMVRSAETLRNREERLRGIMDSVADAIITIDEKGIVQSFNPAAVAIFGYSMSEAVGKNVSMFMPDLHKPKHDGYISKYLKTGKAQVIDLIDRELEGIRKDGTTFFMEPSVTELRHGSHRFFTGIVRDITERKRAQEALRKAHYELELRVEERTSELTLEIAERRKAEAGLRLAAEVIADLNEAVIIVDPKFKVTSVNPAFSEITGYPSNDIIGQRPTFYNLMKKDKDRFKKMVESLEKEGRWEGELWNKNQSGEDYAESLSVSAITDKNGKVQQYAVVVSDITKRKQDEERIRYQANYDALTGLPNRALFHDRLSQALASVSRVDRRLGLMFVDLDGFKLVNDTLGHDIGDLLLQEVSERLCGCVRDGDTVARLGGDEFTIIMPNMIKPKQAAMVADRVIDSLQKLFVLKGHEVSISGSIGVTIYPDDAETAVELLKNADSAMYLAKDQGKSCYQFFTQDINLEVQDRLVIKNNLQKALDRDEFILHYQPKLEILSNQVTGVEALMRWQNEDLGLVPPNKFIPSLEETGMIVDVGEWALRTACQKHVEWQNAGLPPIQIAVNLSARQLREPSFARKVEEILKESGVGSEGLSIEITESMLMSDSTRAVIALGELSEMGIEISMDDFGTGYSSLSYLKRFPIDTIKIDQSFVADITTDTGDAEIIKTIISMGQILNRKVVAEGVETEEQLLLLRRYNCDEIQGYFFSRPLPDKNLVDFLKETMGDTRNLATSNA
jgi:diguanylate cyclase (GGDEF)-like protein/PAS domain S-box-containing protein